MKKINVILLLLVLLVLSRNAMTQITQLEFASGISKTDFTSFSIKPINENRTISISTLAFFQKYHRKKDIIFDEVGVQATVFWNFSTWASVGPSFYYNSVAGFSKRISLMFTSKKKKFSFTSIPSLAYSEAIKSINGELFIQMQFVHGIKNEWNFLLCLVILSSWDKFSRHARSFQQVRVGLLHNVTQFGFAVDFDQYGAIPMTKNSIGLFVRRKFLSKKA